MGRRNDTTAPAAGEPRDHAAAITIAADAVRDSIANIIPADNGAFVLRDIAAVMVNTVRTIAATIAGDAVPAPIAGADVQWHSPAVAFAYSHARTVACPKIGAQWAPTAAHLAAVVDRVAAEYGRNPRLWARRADTVARESSRRPAVTAGE